MGGGFNTARGTLLLDIYTFEFFSSFRTESEELFQTSKGNLFSSKIAMLVVAVRNTLRALFWLRIYFIPVFEACSALLQRLGYKPSD